MVLHNSTSTTNCLHKRGIHQRALQAYVDVRRFTYNFGTFLMTTAAVHVLPEILHTSQSVLGRTGTVAAPKEAVALSI
jgi:hypothetical protein